MSSRNLQIPGFLDLTSREIRSNGEAMDPVSLTLGILPLAGGVIKIYKVVRSKLKIFCHYSSEIKKLRKRFELQRNYFLNELELLIHLVLCKIRQW